MTGNTTRVASLPATACTPGQILQLTRGHWGIENCLHHRKDRSMDKDRCRASESGIGRIMSCLRSLATLVAGRARESLSVLRRRFSRRTDLLLGLLFSTSLSQWERQRRPYKLA